MTYKINDFVRLKTGRIGRIINKQLSINGNTWYTVKLRYSRDNRIAVNMDFTDYEITDNVSGLVHGDFGVAVNLENTKIYKKGFVSRDGLILAYKTVKDIIPYKLSYLIMCWEPIALDYRQFWIPEKLIKFNKFKKVYKDSENKINSNVTGLTIYGSYMAGTIVEEQDEFYIVKNSLGDLVKIHKETIL